MSLLRPICSTLRSPRIPQIALSFRPASSKTVTNPQSGVPEPSPALPAHQPSELTQSDLQQAPNTPTTWSTSQNPKPFAYDNPRFEQVRWDMQPNSLSGMGLGAMDPVRLVEGRKATCDGGEWIFTLRICGNGGPKRGMALIVIR